MDIMVTFADGTTEMRAANSYVHWLAAAWRLKGCGISRRERVNAARYPNFTIESRRNYGMATVWRITGQDPVTKALTGEWQSCRIETVDEQIARLTRERDAEKARASAAVAVADAVAAALAEYETKTRDPGALFMRLRAHPAVKAWRQR